MSENLLKKIQSAGQSIWYDNIQRSLIHSGKMAGMIQEDGIRGITSNPTIFDKAISGGTEYDVDITRYISEGVTGEDLYWALVIKDIQDAADLFAPVYKDTKGVDGFISIEVNPHLANDAEGTIKQAKELHAKVNRKNVMIKVPATKEGLIAIEALVGEGIHVNVTLIFSIQRYREVIEAYLKGLESLSESGKSVGSVQSVASFFVSRVDGVVDAQIDALIEANRGNKELLNSLKGMTGIANSKKAYQVFQEIFASGRFSALKEKGAFVQRPLWASTSVKNPAYKDTLYAEELIGPDTVNTLPPVTVDAFRDHGVAESKITSDTAQMELQLKSLKEVGIDLDQITEKLELDGVKAFKDSFDQLLHHLESKREALALKD